MIILEYLSTELKLGVKKLKRRRKNSAEGKLGLVSLPSTLSQSAEIKLKNNFFIQNNMLRHRTCRTQATFIAFFFLTCTISAHFIW